jgi:hypothetical protein
MPTLDQRQELPAARLVHALRGGTVLCGSLKGAPVDWPPGHTWVGTTEREQKLVSCPGCAAALEKAGGRP